MWQIVMPVSGGLIGNLHPIMRDVIDESFSQLDVPLPDQVQCRIKR